MKCTSQLWLCCLLSGTPLETSAAFQTHRVVELVNRTPQFQLSQSSQKSVEHGEVDKEEGNNMLSKSMGRREAFGTSMLAVSMFTPTAARAFDRYFPDELAGSDKSIGLISIGSRSNAQQRASAAKAKQEEMKKKLINPISTDDILPSLTWSGALWFLSGSRSNALITPLGNLFYDKEKEKWLKDRNDGLFAAPPLPFSVFLGVVFVMIGFWTQFVLLQLTEGDGLISFQLAGVSLIWGGFYEIGRLAVGEKGATRDEFDRRTELEEEFDEFAKARLLTTGNCHRSDVVASFRRYFAKYRDTESKEYPLTDLEINKLLQMWNQMENGRRAEMTSSGFWYGIQINADADVFNSRL